MTEIFAHNVERTLCKLYPNKRQISGQKCIEKIDYRMLSSVYVIYGHYEVFLHRQYAFKPASLLIQIHRLVVVM